MLTEPTDEMLNDPEGHELVQAIHDRKAASAPEKEMQDAINAAYERLKKASISYSIPQGVFVIRKDEDRALQEIQGPTPIAFHRLTRKQLLTLAIALQDQRDNALNLVAAQQVKLDAISVLAESWRYKGEFGWGAWQEGEGPDETGQALDMAAGALRGVIGDPK